MTGLAAGPAPETVVRAVAALAVGATAIVAAALPLAAAADRRASRAAAVWRGAFAALALLLPLALLSPRAPGAPMWVAVPHAPLVAAWELGPVAMSLGGWALALWVVGAAGLLARLAADIRAARALLRRATPTCDPRVARLAAGAARRAGLARAPGLRMSDELGTPALVGWRSPVVLLPAGAPAWSDAELLAVLVHEMAHARRGDWLALVLERAACALLWPNPLVRLARRRAARAREDAADDAVLRAGGSRAAYAGRLIAVARQGLAREGRPRGAWVAGTTPLVADAGAARRVRRLCDDGCDRRAMPAGASAAATLSAVAVALLMALAQPWECLPPAGAAPAPAAAPR